MGGGVGGGGCRAAAKDASDGEAKLWKGPKMTTLGTFWKQKSVNRR